jgi:hypothetical protein
LYDRASAATQPPTSVARGLFEGSIGDALLELASGRPVPADVMADDEPNRPIIWRPEAAQSSNGLWLPTGYADRSQPAPASLGFELSGGSGLAVVFGASRT